MFWLHIFHSFSLRLHLFDGPWNVDAGENRKQMKKKNSSVANEEATIGINRTSLIWYFGINLFVFVALNVNSSQKAQPINMFSTFCIEFKRTALNRIARLRVFKSVTSYCIQIRLSLKWMMQRHLFQKMKEIFAVSNATCRNEKKDSWCGVCAVRMSQNQYELFQIFKMKNLGFIMKIFLIWFYSNIDAEIEKNISRFYVT